MDYLVDMTPSECLDSATRYMVNEGYSVNLRTEQMVELSRRPEISPWLSCLAILLSLGTFGVTFLALVVILVFFKWKATIVAAPSTVGGTRLTANGSHPETTKKLQQWVAAELGERATPQPT